MIVYVAILILYFNLTIPILVNEKMEALLSLTLFTQNIVLRIYASRLLILVKKVVA